MVAILLLTSALLILVDQLIHRNICSPITVFCGLWAAIALLASLRLFGFSGFDENAIKLVLLGVLGFGAGCLLVEAAHSGSTENRVIDANIRLDGPSFNMRLLRVILLLVCIGQLISLLTTLASLSQGATYVDVRGARLGYSDEQYFSNPIVSAYVNYFCGPALSMLTPVAIILWFAGAHRKFCGVVLLCTVSGVVSSGGRITLVYLAIQLVAALLFFRVKISAKARRWVFIAVAVGAVAVAGLTAVRSKTSFLESAYSYFAVPIGLLSSFTEYVDATGFESFVGAFLYPLFYVANAVTSAFGTEIKYLGELVYYVGLPQETWIGGMFPGRPYNAFASLFYYFYLDLREPGVIIFSFAYGVMMASVYRKSFIERSTTWMVWYLLALQSMFGSFIIWQFGGTKFFVSLLLLFLVQRRFHGEKETRVDSRADVNQEGLQMIGRMQ